MDPLAPAPTGDKPMGNIIMVLGIQLLCSVGDNNTLESITPFYRRNSITALQLVVTVFRHGMWDQLAESQPLLRSEQKRCTEPSSLSLWWGIFLCHVMWDHLTESQPLLRREQKRCTEQWWGIFLCHVMLDHLTESQLLLRREQKREMMWCLSLCGQRSQCLTIAWDLSNLSFIPE